MRHLDSIQITRLIPIPLPSRLILFQSLLVLWLLLLALAEPTVLAQPGPQLGATDPMGNPSRYYLLRDDELFVPGVAPFDGQGNGLFYDYTYLPDVNLNLPSPILQQGDDPDYTWDPQIWTAKGRITTPNYDQIVYARRNLSQVALFFVDRNTTKIAFSSSLGSLVDRVDGFTDFIDIAVGDLDKLADSAGVYHDEIAVVWASPGSNNNLTMNVAVLDYTDPSTDSNKEPIATVSAIASNPIDDPSSSGIVPLDNVLGVAVGDFDGDGKGEIAVAHLQNGTTLWITTFRYTNDGKGNRTTTITGSPFIATISVHAGDFNGDGPDEVAVGGSVVISSLSQGAGFVQFYQSDQNLKLTFASSANAFLEPKPYVQRLEVATGLFQFDPAAGTILDAANLPWRTTTGWVA